MSGNREWQELRFRWQLGVATWGHSNLWNCVGTSPWRPEGSVCHLFPGEFRNWCPTVLCPQIASPDRFLGVATVAKTAGMMARRSLPIFDGQARHSAEFRSVMRHQDQPVRQDDGGDHQIVRPNRRPEVREVCPHFAVLLGG